MPKKVEESYPFGQLYGRHLRGTAALLRSRTRRRRAPINRCCCSRLNGVPDSRLAKGMKFATRTQDNARMTSKRPLGNVDYISIRPSLKSVHERRPEAPARHDTPSPALAEEGRLPAKAIGEAWRTRGGRASVHTISPNHNKAANNRLDTPAST